MTHNTWNILKFCFLALCMGSLRSWVYAGGDPTCPSDAFPSRLSPGSQGRVLSSVTMYDAAFHSNPPITELTAGTRFTVPTGSTWQECADSSLWIYVQTGDGLSGWIPEVAYEQYLVEPMAFSAPLTASQPQIEPAGFISGQVDYNGVHFTVPAEMASQVDASYEPASEVREYDPAHLRFQLTSPSGDGSFWVIRVMSAQDVENFYPGLIPALRDVLDGVPGASVPFDLRWIFSDSGVTNPPHEGVIPLGNGKAHWALMTGWQDATNPSDFLENSVVGLTDDNQYYIQATFTTYYKDLSLYNPPDYDAEDITPIIDAFHKTINDTIAAASESDFTPSLSQVQALLASLTVDPGTLQELVDEANLMVQNSVASVPELPQTGTDSRDPIGVLDNGCTVISVINYIQQDAYPLSAPGTVQIAGPNTGVLVDVADDLHFGFEDLAFTVWIQPSPSSTVGGIIFDAQYFSDPSQGLRLRLDEMNRLILQWSDDIYASEDGGWTSYETNVEVPAGAWHLIGVAIDRDNPNGSMIYLDGHPVFGFDVTTHTAPLDAYVQMTLGQQYAASEGQFYGSIKDLRFYKCLLTPAEMATPPEPINSSETTPANDQVAAALPDTQSACPAISILDYIDEETQPSWNGEAFELAGPDTPTQIDLSNAPEFGASDVSFNLWLKRAGTDFEVVFDKRSSGETVQGIAFFFTSDNGIGLQLADGPTAQHAFAESWTNYTSHVYVNDGDWHMITVTIDRDQHQGGKIYLDGQFGDSFDPTDRPGSLITNAPVSLGQRSFSEPAYFYGSIKDLQFYPCLLTDEQISQLAADEATESQASVTQETGETLLQEGAYILTASETACPDDWASSGATAYPTSGNYNVLITSPHSVRVIGIVGEQFDFEISNNVGETMSPLPFGPAKIEIVSPQEFVLSYGAGCVYTDHMIFDSTLDPASLAPIVPEIQSNATPTRLPANSTEFQQPISTSTLFPTYCPGSPPSRVEVGMTARVTISTGGQVRENLRVRATPGGERIGMMTEGTQFRITDDYMCANDLVWWEIQTLDGSLTGWAAEGVAPDDYYIEPVGN